MQLKDYVPPFRIANKEFKTLYSVQQKELDSCNIAISDIVNQCFVETATWGLKYWEEFLGIEVDEAKQTEYRRSVIKAKLRGAGTITVSLIKNVSESFSNGEVDVKENVQPYTFQIKFIGTRGIPPNLDDLKHAIEEIKPAHLAVQYTFTWLSWDEFERCNRTCDTWDSLNLTWDAFEIYKEVG